VYRVMNHDVTYINGSIICSSLMTTSLHYEKEKKKKEKKRVNVPDAQPAWVTGT